jgi:hypothetical protein
VVQSQGGQAVSNHIGDSNKMVSDTPRLVDQILQIILSEKNDWIVDLYRVGYDIERELNAANERIKRLEEENDALRADLLLWNEQEIK